MTLQRNEPKGPDCREYYSRDWGIAYSWHKTYTEAVYLWLTKINEGRPETPQDIPVVFATPERAFADVIRPRVEGQVDIPLISFAFTGSTFDQKRFLPSNIVWEKLKVGDKWRVSPKPLPWNLSYNITVWAKFHQTLDIVAYTLLSRFTPSSYLYVEGRPALIRFGGHNDSSTLESNDDDRILRQDFQIEVEAWMPLPYQETNSVDEVGIVITGDPNKSVESPPGGGISIDNESFDIYGTIEQRVVGTYYKEEANAEYKSGIPKVEVYEKK